MRGIDVRPLRGHTAWRNVRPATLARPERRPHGPPRATRARRPADRVPRHRLLGGIFDSRYPDRRRPAVAHDRADDRSDGRALGRSDRRADARPDAVTDTATLGCARPGRSDRREDRVQGQRSRGLGYDADVTTTITWKEADPEGVTVRVFGVTACLPKTKVDYTACLAKGTPLPANVRELITSAPASKGRVSWTWPNWEDAGGAVMAHGDSFYDSVVIAAYNTAGHSKFVIVRTGAYCPDCTY